MSKYLINQFVYYKQKRETRNTRSKSYSSSQDKHSSRPYNKYKVNRKVLERVEFKIPYIIPTYV